MILDNEQQRTFLLEMFKQVQFPGQVLDLAYEIKQAIQAAPLIPPRQVPTEPLATTPLI